MKYWLVVVQWMVLATAMAAPTKPPKALPPGNRFLFVLETSATMNRLEHGGRQAIFDLIHSAVDGRMRKGDTYGIWTFNELPYVGFYPMQTWDGQRILEHASSAGRFLKMQKYEKDGNLTNLVKQVQAVLRVAKDLNVFIVTDGDTAIGGTPFDAEINAAYSANAPQVRETKKPLVTILTARAGTLTASAVTLAGERILLADLPPPTNDIASAAASPASTNEPPAAATPPKKPPGQVLAVADAEAEAERAKLTNALRQAATTEKVKAPIAEQTTAVVVTTNVPPVTNAVEHPVVVVSAPVTAPPSVAAAPIPEPMPVPTARVAPTDEARPSVPEPLPAIVPAQIKASARTTAAPPAPRPSLFPANLMLILGGAFVGASFVGGLVFLRRVRAPKQPSFISQGMQRK